MSKHSVPTNSQLTTFNSARQMGLCAQNVTVLGDLFLKLVLKQ